MKLNVKKLQKAGTIPLKQDYKFYNGQYNPELKKKIEARAEANKPVNTTSEFIYDLKTKRSMPNPNAKMGLEIVSPEFQLMTAGVGSLGTKAVSTAGKIGQAMLHGAGQGAMANMSNLSGSEQSTSGLAQDVLGGAVVGGLLKGVGLGAKPASKYALQKAEPYLMGDKRIPMMGGYKPKMNVVGYENPNFPRDFEIDDYASFTIDDVGNVHSSTTNLNRVAVNKTASPINHPKIENLLPTDEIQTWADNYGHYANAQTVNKALVKMYGDKYSYVNLDRMISNNQIDDNLAFNILYNAMKKHSNNFNGWITKAEYDLLPKNKSGFTEDELKKVLGNKKLSKSLDFGKTLVKPNNKIILHQENTPINSTEMPMEIYLDIFNKNLPKLNKIIEKNNKSGIPYKVERLENSYLHFNSELGNSSFGVAVKPGKFKGKVLDVGDENYYKNLPGLNMTNTTSSVFGDNIPRSGSGAYKSINEYLKLLKLGRVKPGFNSQTVYSKGLWNDAILKNKAVGFFKNPATLVGSMKSVSPIVGSSLLYNQIQSKKQGGKLIPKGQSGLKTNYIEPFHNSPYNFLNKPMSADINYESTIPFIVEHEGKKIDKQGNHIVYKDGKGIDTIGYGLTSKQYISKGKISEDEARQGMRMHIDKEVLPHLKNKPYWNNLSENQKTALASYVYNIGSGAFNTKSPSLQKALSESNWNEAAKQMDFGYNDSKNPGLKTRREKERNLFLNGTPEFKGKFGFLK